MYSEFLRNKEKEMRRRREIQQRNFRKIMDSLDQTKTDSDVTREEERVSRLLRPVKLKVRNEIENNFF